MKLFNKITKRWKKIIEAIDHYMDLISRIRDVERTVRLLQRQLTSLQAIDQTWHEGGKIIVLAHVGEKDYIKIIQMKPKVTIQEYQEMVKHLEALYGARAVFIDAIIPKREWTC